MSDLLLAYYADDFTGATDALECLELAGIRTALFIEPPTPEQIAAIPGLRAVGVAGMTRTMSPEQIEAELRPAFTALRQLDSRHVHYKICSTFDSSPTIGSIGRAIDVGAEVFGGLFVPMVVGSPALGRYCVFGNLFARMGIGSTGEVYRLDRHPSMSRHPVTPADESDLRIHLAKQTSKSIGLFDVLELALPIENAGQRLAAKVASGEEIVLFDSLTYAHIEMIGGLLDSYASAEHPFFSVGSSSIETAVAAKWQRWATSPLNWPSPGEASPLLVASGSCSPVTVEQIAWARAHGFAEVVAGADAGKNVEQTADEAAHSLKSGRHVVIHTGAKADVAGAGGNIPAKTLGTALGNSVRATLERVAVRRVCLAGGDTSSFAARGLGIEALEMIAPLTPGAPLCRARAPGSPADGVEFVFKGGQVGAVDYFDAVVRGKLFKLND